MKMYLYFNAGIKEYEIMCFSALLSRFIPFCPGASRSVPGQKGGTERLGQMIWDRTSPYLDEE